MLYKCANPVCSNQFLHLREGKLFQVETEFVAERQSGSSPDRPRRKGLRHREYYWLCDQCAPYVTLDYDAKQGIVTIPLSEGVVHRTVLQRPPQGLLKLQEDPAIALTQS